MQQQVNYHLLKLGGVIRRYNIADIGTKSLDGPWLLEERPGQSEHRGGAVGRVRPTTLADRGEGPTAQEELREFGSPRRKWLESYRRSRSSWK